LREAFVADPLTFIRIADTETTGFPPDAEIVEIGWTDIRLYPDGWQIEADGQSRFVNPGRPIPQKATEIHGITDAMVAGGMEPDEARAFIARGPDFLCAHNADFDSKFLRGHGLPWICTLQCARQAWRGMPNYQNETLRERLGIEVTGDAHRAGYDSAVTARILIKLLEVMTLEQMVKVSMPSYQPLRMPFGAHAGKLFSEIPTSYLRWIATSDLSVGIKAAARAEIARNVQSAPAAYPEPDPDAWRNDIGRF
jgi:exodeoxyribonuclease X